MAGGLDHEFLAQLDLLLQQHHDRLFSKLLRCSSATTATTSPSRSASKRKASNCGLSSCEVAESARPMIQAVPESAHEEAVHLDDMSSETRSNGSTFSAAERQGRALSLRQGSLARMEQGKKRSSVRDRVNAGLLVKLPKYARRLVSQHAFEVLMSVMIMSNALFSGVEVEYLAQNRVFTPPREFRWLGLFYSVAFTFELLLRLLAEGLLGFFWSSNSWKWNYFDLCIVTISMVELTMDAAGTGDIESHQMPSIRVIRMARVVRVLRIARLMRQFRSLRVLIYSVFNTLRSLVWTMMLLLLILGLFGMLFTQATTQHVLESDAPIEGLWQAYGTVGRSVFTLFKAICGGVSWQEVVEPLGELHGIWVLFYLVYFTFVYFAVLNVVTGVFCQTAIESANRDQDLAAQAQLAAKQACVQQLQQLFKQVDNDGNGTITLEEFEEGMKDEKMQAYFASIDISIDEAFSLFKLLDRDENHAIGIDNFVAGCLKLRGPAKCMDIAMMMYETRWSLRKTNQAIRSLEERISNFRDSWTPPGEDGAQLANSSDVRMWQGRPV